MIDLDLKTKLETLTTLPVFYNAVQASKEHIWFQRSSQERHTLLDGTLFARTSEYDLEIVGTTIDDTLATAETITAALHMQQWAESVIQCRVEDATDEYQMRSYSDETGVNFTAIRITIIAKE